MHLKWCKYISAVYNTPATKASFLNKKLRDISLWQITEMFNILINQNCHKELFFFENHINYHIQSVYSFK